MITLQPFSDTCSKVEIYTSSYTLQLKHIYMAFLLQRLRIGMLYRIVEHIIIGHPPLLSTTKARYIGVYEYDYMLYLIVIVGGSDHDLESMYANIHTLH